MINSREAVDFLRWLGASDWHNLVCIDPETKAIEGRTFEPDSWDAIKTWVEEHADWNQYFSINEPRAGARNSKLRRDEIGNLRAFAVDLDHPPAGYAWGDPCDDLAPSAVVNSGNGLWGFWRLEQKESADMYSREDQNKALAAKFGGDPVAVNLDRIARLPGTTNHKRGTTKPARAVRTNQITYTPQEIAEWCPPVLGSIAPKLGTDQPLIDLDTPESVAKATAYLIQDAPEAIEGDNGDAVTYQVAAKLKDIGVSEPLALDLLLDFWNEQKASPPWDLSELRVKVRNAYSYGTALPGKDSRQMAEVEFEATPVNGGLPIAEMSPFDAAAIPKRQWVLGRFLARGFTSAIVSPPGTGKTTFLCAAALAIATGRSDIVDLDVHERCNVLLWNQEDDENELKRRIAATMIGQKIGWDDTRVNGRIALHMGSGVDRGIMLAKRGNDGSIKRAPDFDLIRAYIKEHNIGVAIFDPFVEMHPAEENNNTEVAAVARVFRRIAVDCNCAVVIVHHTRKPAQGDATGHAGNIDSARGAGSLVGVLRSGATLYTLDAKTGAKYGLPEAECRRYVRLDDGKNNLNFDMEGALRLYRREGVKMGPGDDADEVGMLRPVKLVARAMTKSDERRQLLEIAATALAPNEDAPSLSALSDEICTQAFYSDVEPDAIAKRLKRYIGDDGADIDGGRLTLVKRNNLKTGGKYLAVKFERKTP
jgi:AAA domain/RepB DNA-primase from phage plasmid